MGIKNEIKRYFFDLGPNRVRVEHIKLKFQDLSNKEIKTILEELVDENFLKKISSTFFKDIKNKISLNHELYKLNNDLLGEYPFKTEIKVGEILLPRFLEGGQFHAEDANSIYLLESTEFSITSSLFFINLHAKF